MRHRRGNTIGSVQFGKKPRLHTVQEKNHQPKWHDSMSEMLPAEVSVQTPSVARQVDIEPPSPPPQISMAERWVDIVQAAPPLAMRKTEPMVHAARAW